MYGARSSRHRQDCRAVPVVHPMSLGEGPPGGVVPYESRLRSGGVRLGGCCSLRVHERTSLNAMGLH
jgi:hypothetical protein